MASGELFPPSAPPVIRAGWQCGGCRTHYSPDVRECHCEAGRRTLADRMKPPPPIRLGGGTKLLPELIGTVSVTSDLTQDWKVIW